MSVVKNTDQENGAVFKSNKIAQFPPQNYDG